MRSTSRFPIGDPSAVGSSPSEGWTDAIEEETGGVRYKLAVSRVGGSSRSVVPPLTDMLSTLNAKARGSHYEAVLGAAAGIAAVRLQEIAYIRRAYDVALELTRFATSVALCVQSIGRSIPATKKNYNPGGG